MNLLKQSAWGPSSHNIQVKLNELPSSLGPVVSIDVETDERDNFVGGAIFDGSQSVYYYTDLTVYLGLLQSKQVVGHNVKADLTWLNKWGGKFVASQIEDDSMIYSYTANSNKESHGLKDLVRELLNWHYPSYKDIVGTGRKKVTLDKQDVELVAEYCCMDAICAWELIARHKQRFSTAIYNLYKNLELPVYRMLWEMEQKGIKIDTTLLAKLDKEFTDDVTVAKAGLLIYDLGWNPNSPLQTVKILQKNKVQVSSSDKPSLLAYKGTPIVDALLKYRKLKKLHSTYIEAFRLRNTDTIHTTFNQVAYQADGSMKGIRTGRLSSNDPNLQNIPAIKKTETYGKSIRSLFIPTPGKVFIDADYSQIEYRLLAHFSQEPTLLNGFRQGLDVHETTGKLLGCDRNVGKTLNFASIYGAQASKIAATAGITEGQALQFLAAYWQKLPSVTSWINQTKMLAKGNQGITTMAGRWIPLPELKSNNRWERAHAERAAINYIIQGSAADIIKQAMLNLQVAGYMPVLQVHDELLFEVPPESAHLHMNTIKSIMESAVTLSIPLKVDIHTGNNWAEAKGA